MTPSDTPQIDTSLAAKRRQARARFLARERASLQTQPPLPRALHEECGVFGIIGYHDDVAPIVALGLHALQHRGQESCGITTCADRVFHADKTMGLVSEKFFSEAALEALPGPAGIGHTRYSTTGDSTERNVQPFFADFDRGGLAIAHNGNLTNALTLRAELIKQGRIFHTTSDSELFLKLASMSRALTIPERIIDSVRRVDGAYALTMLTADALIGVRDPLGIRPLVLGRLGDAYLLASETCAIDAVNGEVVREVEPGEMVICRADGSLESRRCFPTAEQARPCIFELIYFARPNSFMDGQSIYTLRKCLGARLAQEAAANMPVEADLVAPIPDGGVAAAIGYAEEAGLPYEMALIRSHYVGRTFIEPSQRLRELGVMRKLSPNPGIVKGKRVILVDDSLVRGTTSATITRMLFEAGAREVHFRIACPEIRHPDFYGIDTPDKEKLLAAQMSNEEIRQKIGATSLTFLSLDGLYEALGKGPRQTQAPAFTDHCFTGEYPTALIDQDKAAQEPASVTQLSFLKESG